MGVTYVIVPRGNPETGALIKLSYAVPDARDLEGAPRLCEAPLQRWGRPAVSEHAVNVDHFIHRPVAAVTALLPDRQSVESALGDLQSAGFDAEHARILDGEEGARILDRTGTEHGFRTEFVRALQSLGYEPEHPGRLRRGAQIGTSPDDGSVRHRQAVRGRQRAEGPRRAQHHLLRRGHGRGAELPLRDNPRGCPQASTERCCPTAPHPTA